MTNRRRVAGKAAVNNSAVKDANYKLVVDKAKGQTQVPEQECILKPESTRPRSSSGGGYDYDTRSSRGSTGVGYDHETRASRVSTGVGYEYDTGDDAGVSRLHKQYRMLPDTEYTPNSPMTAIRRGRNVDSKPPIRAETDYNGLHNTRV